MAKKKTKDRKKMTPKGRAMSDLSRRTAARRKGIFTKMDEERGINRQV